MFKGKFIFKRVQCLLSLLVSSLKLISDFSELYKQIRIVNINSEGVNFEEFDICLNNFMSKTNTNKLNI